MAAVMAVVEVAAAVVPLVEVAAELRAVVAAPPLAAETAPLRSPALDLMCRGRQTSSQ